MVSTAIKAVLISIGITTMALFLKTSVPMAVDFSLSRSPILWSSFLSWLKPPYLFVVINVIITIIAASSSYHDGEDEEISHGGGDFEIQSEQIVHQDPPRRVEVNEVDLDAEFNVVVTFPPPIVVEKSEVVCEEKKEEISGVINGGDEFVVLTSKLTENQVPPMMELSENLTPTEKPLVSARSSHRKPVKAITKVGNKKKKALRVAKPKREETSTMENTWKMVAEEGKSTTLTSHYRRSNTLGLGGGEVQPALRKAETFRDMTNYQKSSTVTVTPPVKMNKEMSPSREELNRRIEAFIRKCKEERLVESMRLDKEVVVA